MEQLATVSRGLHERLLIAAGAHSLREQLLVGFIFGHRDVIVHVLLSNPRHACMIICQNRIKTTTFCRKEIRQDMIFVFSSVFLYKSLVLGRNYYNKTLLSSSDPLQQVISKYNAPYSLLCGSSAEGDYLIFRCGSSY